MERRYGEREHGRDWRDDPRGNEPRRWSGEWGPGQWGEVRNRWERGAMQGGGYGGEYRQDFEREPRFGQGFGDPRHGEGRQGFGSYDRPGEYGPGPDYDAVRDYPRTPYYGALGYGDYPRRPGQEPTRFGGEYRGGEFESDEYRGRGYRGGDYPGGTYQYEGLTYRREPERRAGGFYGGQAEERGRWQEGRESGRRGGMLRRMQGRGPKGYKRSDERIKEDICERLMEAEHVDSSDVSVEVREGKVTLEGTVPERRMKHEIEDVVDDCMGVEDIDNRIRVERRAPEDAPQYSGEPSKILAGEGGSERAH